MTLNYATQEETTIYADTEVFLPITIEKAYELGIEKEPEPEPAPVLAPKPVIARQQPAAVVAPAPKPEPQPIAQPAPAPKPQTAVEKIAFDQEQKEQQKPAGPTCRADQCIHDNKCFDKPEFGVCTPEDPTNAWVCVGDYIDTGSTCASKEQLEKEKNNIYAGKVVAAWYDNSPRVVNGFYGGQCTYHAAKRRPDIFPYVSPTKQTRDFGGNAKDW
jgi:hypothetical protein